MRVLPLLAAALLLAACGSETAAPTVLRAEVPAALQPGEVTPDARYPSGSRIVERRAADGSVRRVWSAGLDAAGGVLEDADGKTVYFTGREAQGEPYVVYRAARDGSRREVAVKGARDVAEPWVLPDGRIVCMGQVDEGWALFVADGDGGPGQRITFGGGIAYDPAVLKDGRIVYLSRRDGRTTLLAVHPDGTGVAPLAGGGSLPASPERLAPGEDGRSLFYREPAEGAAWQLDLASGTTAVVEAPAPRRVLRDVQGHLTSVRPMRWGQLLGLDARHPDGQGGTRVRIASPDMLGEAELEADGSFFVQVPTDTPLRVELLDAEGAVLVRLAHPLWVRPNETRALVGLNEPPGTAPPNRRPRALAREAFPLRPPEEDSR